MEGIVQNPGSALGEAIGALMEKVLNPFLDEVATRHDCHLFNKGKVNPKTNQHRKLLLVDEFYNAYNLDGVIVDDLNHPLILLEYKYIRYTKHNRDKGSWLCTAHGAIRRRYHSVRSSIAILAGSWSKSSVAMMTSHDINLFIIPFEHIVRLLAAHNIKFDWGEKDRDVAVESWEKFSALDEAQKQAIGEAMIAEIKPDIEKTIDRVLNNKAKREIDRITLEIHTNLGEVRRFVFKTVNEALDFLEDFSIEALLDVSKSFTLFEAPETLD